MPVYYQGAGCNFTGRWTNIFAPWLPPPSTLLLFVTEDCARCHPYVLWEIIQLMKTKKAQVDPLAYHRVLEDLANQPVDRSAAYLAVACLKDLTALTTTTTSTITTTTTSGWYDMVTDGGTGFVTCMEHLVREWIRMDSTRVHLSAMVALLILAGWLPQSPSQFQSQMEMFCREVPTTPRLYPMPAFAQDRHTRRGREMKNTLRDLEARCAKRGLQMPSNPEYTHGPSAFQTRQGFAEFMKRGPGLKRKPCDSTRHNLPGQQKFS